MTAVVPSSYVGPECPRCRATLPEESLITGTIACPACGKSFEAVALRPPERTLHTVQQLATAGPEGASSCANHARNAAVTSCSRCGLFICSLCEMNAGGGTYCPSCFDRLRTDGSTAAGAVRYRDYVTMARVCAIIGLIASLFFFGWAFGAASLFYARRAFAQIRERGGSKIALWLVIVLAIIEIVGGLSLIGFVIWAIAKA